MHTQFSKMFRRPLFFGLRSLVLVTVTCATLTHSPLAQQSPLPGQELKPILGYISTAWDTLTRSVTDCQSLVDPKLKEAAVLYLPSGIAGPTPVRKLLSQVNGGMRHIAASS